MLIQVNMLPEPLRDFKVEAEKSLSELEKLRGTTVFPLLYSWNRLISKPDVDDIYDCLLEIGPQPKLDVILFARGGDPDQAYVIGNILQDFAREKLTIIVPRFAKSAATLIACAGDEIIMGSASELGPIDLIVERTIDEKRWEISAVSVMELLKMIKDGTFGDLALKVIELIDKHLPLVELGDYGRLTEHTEFLAKRLLARRMCKDNPNLAENIARELCREYRSHGAAIVSQDLKDKMKISNIEDQEAWRLIWNFHKLWISKVIGYENNFPAGAVFEPIEFRVGKGIAFCTKLIESEK